MVACGVRGCSSRTEVNYQDGIRFFSIPAIRKNVPLYAQRRYEKQRTLWLSKIGRMDLMLENSNIKVCSRHFVSGAPAASTDESSPDWGPSTNLGINDAPQQVDSDEVIVEPESVHPVGIVGTQQGETSENHNMTVQAGENIAQDSVSTQLNVSSGGKNLSQMELIDSEFLVDSGDFTGNVGALEGQVCDGELSVESNFIDHSFEGNFDVERNILNSTMLRDNVSEEFHGLQAEYNELIKAHAKLRDELTEAEVDKLELSDVVCASDEKCEGLAQKCEALEAESASLKAKVGEYKSRVEVLEEQAKITARKMNDLEDKLAKATKCIITLEGLQSNDALVSYYTGLPSYGVFNAVLTLVLRHVTEKTRSLEPWQCLLITLMRLRLGLQLEDLAFRFGICKGTACAIFERWLYYLYVYLEPCVNWPDRETLYKTMPNSFKAEFGKSVAVIIDCFELFCERPGALDSRAMTWSNYKHHNTVKFLIGITPLGAVSFISQGWGGRVSDKHITAHSGLYEKLLPQDVIMADRGFTIGEDVGFYCAKVLIPAFTRGQAQLSAHDITDTRRLASLRVHVERVIGVVKNRYRILKSTLHHSFLDVKPGHTVAQIDEVVRVCCALTNLSPGIV